MKEAIKLQREDRSYYNVISGQERIREFLNTVGYARTLKGKSTPVQETNINRLAIYVSGALYIDYNPDHDLVVLATIDLKKHYTLEMVEELVERELEALGM